MFITVISTQGNFIEGLVKFYKLPQLLKRQFLADEYFYNYIISIYQCYHYVTYSVVI